MEGFGSLVFLVGLFWTLLHLLQALFSRRRNRQSLALPVPALSGLHSHPGSLRTTSLRIALHKLYLRIEFSGLNRSHDKFTTILQRTERSKQRRYLTLLYDLGTALCCAGMVAAIGILFWATFQLLLALGSNVGVHPVVQPVTSTVVKRNFDSDPLPEVAPSSSIGTSNLSIQLLIPGVTVPLSHIIPLLLALLTSQVIHEAGHAIAAAMESIPILSTGISLHLLLPSAFVALPAAAVQELPPRARLRVISGGPFHNFILWVFLGIISWSGIGSPLLSVIGYKNIGHYGRVVVHVSADSPLHAHVPVGSIITKLNDLSLTSNDPSVDLWTKYLSQQQMDVSAELGWCTDRKYFLEQPDSCCAPNHADSELSCFTGVSPLRAKSRIQKCISPLFLVDPEAPLSAKRCRTAPDCSDSLLCVKPRPDEELLRITLWTPDRTLNVKPSDRAVNTDTHEKVVMWSGPLEEVLEELQVSRHAPRLDFLPIKFPVFLENCFKYLSTLTLSLFLFNLLPLPRLDGEQFLDTLLKVTPEASDELVNLEAGTPIARAILPDVWKRHALKACQGLVSGLIAVCITLGVVLLLK